MTHAHHHHDHAQEPDWAAMAELLDLDAEVMHSYQSEMLDWVGELAEPPVARILDLGAGTGAGALELARRFPQAEVIAVDGSADLLARCLASARERGVAARIRPVHADLDAGWPVSSGVDLAWASRSLHHLAAPDSALASLFATIRSGGTLAVAEIESFPRFLPDDIGIGRPGLEERCHAALAEQQAHELPHLGADWSALIRQAGFTVEAERTFNIDLRQPLPAAAGRYARASLQRIRPPLTGRLDADDLEALDALIDSDGPASVLRRGDLSIRAARTVLVSRRP
jgi:ubiquinone/menaquinone biosynthesis C-methylase UbiE